MFWTMGYVYFLVIKQLNYNFCRYPQIIFEARCMYAGCLSQKDPSKEICSSMSTLAVTSTIPVIEMSEGLTDVKYCTDTSCKTYEVQFQFGCTCVFV